MQHPFALKNQISVKQASAVSGAGKSTQSKTYHPSQLVAALPEDFRKVIRPPVVSTQAIGEEGGSFPEQSDF